MKRLGLILLTMLLCCNVMARQERDTLGVGTLVSFVENRGQWEHPFLFEAQLHNAALFLEERCITIALRESIPHPAPRTSAARGHAYRMHFSGCNPVVPKGMFPQATYNNYLLGSNPARWQGNVPLYDAVHYNNLYDNIDLEVYGGSQALKYNFVVHPGGDASHITLIYEGSEGVEVTGNGSLRIKTTVRDVIEMKPYVYQMNDNGDEVEVSSGWRVQKIKGEKWKVWIELGDYLHNRDLVIDPVLIFSTYTGSTSDNWGTTATYDSEKNVYTAGLVFGIGYPVSLGAYQTAPAGICDVGIFKFDSTGTQRLYATYLGGSHADMPHSLFVNSFNELLVFGTTGSANFPVTTGAYQTSHAGGSAIAYEGSDDIHFPNGSDIFVSRLSADGTQLLASTYVGGSGNDGLNYRSYYNSSTQIVICRIILGFPDTAQNLFLGLGIDPDSFALFIMYTCHLLHKSVNILSLSSGVRAYIDCIHILPVQQTAYNLILFLGTLDHFVFEILRNKRNRRKAPSSQLFIVDLRITHGHQMTHTPGYDSLIGLQITIKRSHIIF